MPDIQRILDLLLQGPPEGRAAILDRECGADAELRHRIEAMLEAAERDALFSGPTSAGASSSAMPTLRTGPASHAIGSESPGSRIGPYKLLQPLGEGGFGTVWMAEQDRPVQRRVALKVIKLGMDTKAVIARFEQERQALAILDHPNIAKVFDAGSTDTGRPYFVMELYTGEPIDTYCDKQNLSIRERLELFEQVCQAVQHAHTKGLIHRDIKPSNILVSQQDGKPHAKVIDFGIAKATAAKLTEKTLFTEHKQLIGTPEYMSPEQAEGSLDIDTRTDVYSLGVLLYELLTGSTPFSSRELRSAAYAEIQRIIREVDPPKPSTRLSQSADSLAAVAAHRHTEPRRLGTIIRGELDWIVMKALEKDRTRRYETASGFGADIRRYLSGRAVVAAPPSTAYRVRKFVKRHKAGVFATSLVAAALILGLAGTIWQYTVATEQRDTAKREAVRATAAEAEARRRADELKKVADFQGQMLAQVDPSLAGLRLTEDIRTRFTDALVKASVPEDQRTPQVEAFIGQWSRINTTDTALELIDRTILKPAAETIDKQFADQPIVAASLRHVLAERYHDLGLDAAALALEEKALVERRRILGEDHDDTLKSINNLGAYFGALGKNDECERSYREALEKSRRVRGPEHPETLVCVNNVGVQLMEMGRTAEAEVFLKEALDARRRTLGDNDPDTIGSIHSWAAFLEGQGKLAEAEEHYREAIEKRRKILGEDHYETLQSLNNLATLLNLRGKLHDSAVLFREIVDRKSRKLGEAHPSTLASIQSLATMLEKTGQSAEAEVLMRETYDKERRLLGPDHSSTLTALGNICVYLINRGKFTEAEPLCRETLDRRRRVLGENHSATLIATNVMGLVLVRQGKLGEGEEFWNTALETAQRTLGPTHPDTLTYMQNLGGLALDQKKFDVAERRYRDVLAAAHPSIGPEHPITVAATRRLGALLLSQKKFAESFELLTPVEAPSRKLYTGTNARSLALVLKDIASARAGLAQFAEAESHFLEAHTIIVKLRGENHQDSRPYLEALITFYTAWDKADPGKGHDTKAAEWQARVPPAPPPAPDPK